MKQFKIILPTVAEAKEFVAAASRCDFDIDVFYNRVIIDAKSILGVLSLDLSQILTVQLNGAEAEFEKHLKKLAPENSSAA
ncbi:MAG: Phosphotransferase system, phosphocarrier protein HPr [Lacrimispora sp.]|jgi:phosphotransferase system HPr-like phosphotransfer protein|nr:Phosphotransferase system, phosphocarrier protein HPr [Lacrimispora sp.]